MSGSESVQFLFNVCICMVNGDLIIKRRRVDISSTELTLVLMMSILVG
jgi:hypothetical protein